jgi:hypothetical protein
VKKYSPKCSEKDIAKMVDLPNSRPTRVFSAVPSVVKRSWSANKMNQSKGNLPGVPQDKMETSNNFKFTTLTETKPPLNKPARFFSATSKLPPVNKLQNLINVFRYLRIALRLRRNPIKQKIILNQSKSKLLIKRLSS